MKRVNKICDEIGSDNVIRIWEKANFSTYFINTVIVTIFAVIIVLIMTMLAGYAMGRYNFFGKKLIMGIFLGSIVIPLVSTIIPTYEVVKQLHLVGTKTGLVLAQAGGVWSFCNHTNSNGFSFRCFKLVMVSLFFLSLYDLQPGINTLIGLSGCFLLYSIAQSTYSVLAGSITRNGIRPDRLFNIA